MSNDANKGYQFTVVNGAVTAVYEFKNGRAKFEKMNRNEIWSVDGNNIVKTEAEHGRVETTVYSDIDGDGVFAKMSQSDSTAAVTVNLFSHPATGFDNDDLWRGNNRVEHFEGGQGNDRLNGALCFENDILYGSTDRETAAEFQIELIGVPQLSLTDFMM